MFTGIVRELGRVEEASSNGSGLRLRIAAPETAATSAVGDSVAVNGVCLTAVAVEDGTIAFDVVAESLARSTLGRLGPDAGVNLELPVRAGEPLGGHYVQGHVDGTGTVRAVDGEGVEIAADPEILRYCVEKGSIAVEGVSLTVAALTDGGFHIALIPHTREATTLGSLEAGDPVNLEVDVLAKYVEALTTR